MTAEIAILNKSAIALAADSAVTISAGSNQEKIFDSADKLFELSRKNSIGVMVNNDMDFLEAPISVLIKKYRRECKSFKHVKEAAKDFLNYLLKFAQSAPEKVKLKHLTAQITPILNTLDNRIRREFFSKIESEEIGDQSIQEAFASIAEHQISVIQEGLSKSMQASFLGRNRRGTFTSAEKTLVKQTVERKLDTLTEAQHNTVQEMLFEHIDKVSFTRPASGLVIAGFGSEDVFPTLVSFELHGMVGNRLKYVQTNEVDIDRDGERARVLPFAQKEMVERFLYGLDEGIERKVGQFCSQTVPNITKKIISSLEMSDADKTALINRAKEAEGEFLLGLAHESFEAIRAESRSEIEDMVEFMPKPELAKMAEALVNLTSIKRRVSRGMETVGGPIDVAVISQSEGFVWVERKHYFRPELNHQYFTRMASVENACNGEEND